MDLFNMGGPAMTDGKTSASCPTELQKCDPSIQFVDMDFKALAKDRQKKDNHNMSKCSFHFFFGFSSFLRTFDFRFTLSRDVYSRKAAEV